MRLLAILALSLAALASAGFNKPTGGAKIVGAPSKADPEDEGVIAAARQAVFKYNEQTNSADYYGLVRVKSATQQVVAGIKYSLDLEVAPTTCAKSQKIGDATKLAETCALKQSSAPSSVNAVVVRQQWKATEAEPDLQWSVAFRSEAE